MKNTFNLQVLIVAASLGLAGYSCSNGTEKNVVVQAHRGGAALFPENTIPAMINAVKIGTKTLELDLQITKDSQVVVSHDSYLNSLKVLYPNGEQVTCEEQETLQLFYMSYDSICKFDVGSLQNPLYPRRTNLPCVIPTLTNLIDCVEAYVYSSGSKTVNYNIEIKSAPEKDGVTTPDYRTFCDLSMEILLKKKLSGRLCIQSFDPRSLNYIHQKYPNVTLSYLVDNPYCSFEDYLKQLDFVPNIISPNYAIIDKDFVTAAHNCNMKVIPWTVDSQADVLRLKDMGVDEIITNQPDSVRIWLDNDSHDMQYSKAVAFYENLMGY